MGRSSGNRHEVAARCRYGGYRRGGGLRRSLATATSKTPTSKAHGGLQRAAAVVVAVDALQVVPGPVIPVDDNNNNSDDNTNDQGGIALGEGTPGVGDSGMSTHDETQAQEAEEAESGRKAVRRQERVR